MTQAKVEGAVLTLVGRFLNEIDEYDLDVRLQELCEDEEPFAPVQRDELPQLFPKLELTAFTLIVPGTLQDESSA